MGLFDWFKKYEVIPFRFIINGNEVVGYLYSPKKWNQKGIVYLHGGFDFYPKPEAYEDVIAYANAGWAVLLIKYDTEGWKNIASQDYAKDIQEAIDAAVQFIARAKPRKLFLMGVSRGCAVAYGAYAAAPSDVWDGGVFIAGPTHISTLKKTTQIPLATLGKMLSYFKISPIDLTYSPKKSKAMLLVYGGQDIIIPAAQGVLMATKLNLQTGKDFFALNYGHDLAKEKETQILILKWLENKG